MSLAHTLLRLKEEIKELENEKIKLSGQIEMVEGELTELFNTSNLKQIKKELRKEKIKLKQERREREEKVGKLKEWING